MRAGSSSAESAGVQRLILKIRLQTHPTADTVRLMRVALLGSGRGSNADAVLRAQANGQLGSAKVMGVYCDLPTAPMLALGPKYGVPAHFLDPGPFKTKFSPEQEAFWARTLAEDGVDLVVLAGFMRVVKAPLLEPFAGRIINLHPTLLPAFPGLDGIGQTWRAGVPEGGCTVHWVTAEVDGGGHLGQARSRARPTIPSRRSPKRSMPPSMPYSPA